MFFRSLNLEQENKEREQEREKEKAQSSFTPSSGGGGATSQDAPVSSSEADNGELVQLLAAVNTAAVSSCRHCSC